MTDLAWRLLHEGYDAVRADREARGGGADYSSRLLGQSCLVVRSEEGARAFYDESLVKRAGVVPPPLAWLLFGRGALHGLDGQPHRDRKMTMLDILAPEALPGLLSRVDHGLERAVDGWRDRDEVVVFRELVAVYGRAVLAWAGVDVLEPQATDVSERLARIVDGFGFAGPAYLRGCRDRRWCNRWAAGVIADVRSGRTTPPTGSAVELLASRPDLDDHTAGVELLNVVRPTVAVAWLGTFAVRVLAQHPEWRESLGGSGRAAARCRLSLAQEVRRTTLFVPVLAARAVRAFSVDGTDVTAGQPLVLDVVGINHDPDRWPMPAQVDPDRFHDRLPGAFDLVAQGGGGPGGHRCPGESVTLGLLELTLRHVADVTFRADALDVDRTRMPTLPRNGLRISEVRVAQPA